MKKPGFLFALALIAVSCNKSEKPAGGGPPQGGALSVGAVEGFVARATELAENVTAAGTLVPAEETELHPEASGRVVSINLPEGRSVKKGDLLLRIFDEDLKAQQKKLETQLRQAEITEQRLGELLRVKGVSQQEYDLAVLNVQTLKTDMELVRINISKTELRAPYDGVIGLRRLSPGAYVTPSTVVTTIRASSGLKLDFSIPEKYNQLIRVGQGVNFRVEGDASEHTATVTATEQMISEDARNLLVRATVRESRGLLPGAFAEVSLILKNKPQALMIPNQAVIPQARDKKVILCNGGKARFVTVKTGVRQSGMVEVLEGIQAGDTVCTTGVLFLRPDSPVKFSRVD
jgi:membrane fusion protein (multidrug efflux system)